MKKLIIILFIITTSFSISAQDISGKWNGILKVQGIQLRLVFNISQTEKGYRATMDSPDQRALGIPVTSAKFENSILKLEVSNAGIKYEGTLNKENVFIGTFKQSGQSFPLTLTKNKIEKAIVRRPQEPSKPYPYYSEEVKFENTKDNIVLAGTLTLPNKNGKFPAVILISGSGPQNRDEELFDHKPFLVLADYLTKNGIAVLRFDERGVGESEGDFKTATINEFSTDINSVIEYLKSREEIDITKIGLIGHSLGGIIAPKVASQNKDVSFIVLLAGPGINGDELMLSQKAALDRIMGLNEMQIAQRQSLMKGAYDIITKSDLDNAGLKDSINSFYINKYGKLFPENQRKKVVEQITSYEVVSLIKSKPSIYLSKVKCPVLAINGSKDFQVPAKENLEAIKKVLEANGNKKVKTVEFDNLNHLFQECETGAINEYASIEQTISPIALKGILNWILQQIK